MTRTHAHTRAGRARRLTIAAAVTVLLGAVPAGTAVGHDVACGQEISSDTALTHDLGPCPGDGLIVTASNVTLDLGGHTISALNGDGDHAGVRLRGVRGVTVINGTVQGFDAGIVIGRGGQNTVRGVTAQDNVNDFLAPPCLLGDGVAVLDSDGNTIAGNRLLRNGPFGGVSLIGDSDGNLIIGNEASDNAVLAASPFCGNSRQDEGIRIEGPGADDNRVEGNTVERNLLAGIGLHGYVCSDAGGDDIQPPNTGSVVVDNTVTATAGTSIASGISILQQGPATIVCPSYGNVIDGNVSSGNEADGIFVAANSYDNRITDNTVEGNGRDGIHLNGPRLADDGTQLAPGAHDNSLVRNRGQGNAQFDGFDGNEQCDDNRWRNNRFLKVNQGCVLGPGGS